MKNDKIQLSNSFVQYIKLIIGQSRAQAVSSVEFYRVFPIANALRSQLNWMQKW